LASFGDALCLSPVNVLSENTTNQMALERIALLYPSILFLLSTLPNQQEYQIEVDNVLFLIVKQLEFFVESFTN
jgi:hypothetical protein